MRIVFMGTPDFAIPSLRRLVESPHQVVGVVTAPDRPAGRGQQLRPSPVKVYAESQGIPVLQPEKLRNSEFRAALTEMQPDLAVVVAFRMLPEVVWSIPQHGTLNLHAALLPDYRGAAPLNWVLINGETRTGATTFLIDHKIDTGAVLLQRSLDIPEEWNAGDLHDAMMEFGAELVRDTVDALVAGNVTPKAQDHSGFLHPAPKIFKDDCRIDWQRPAAELYNFIRGLSPYPAAWTTLDGQMLKVFRVRKVECEGQEEPGKMTVLDGKIFVGTGQGWLEIEALQLAGKKRMSAGDFLRGYKETLTHVE